MSKFNILMIDDEPNNFEVVETLLAHENYDVYYANNGKDALASLDAFKPDLILLDVLMPDMDGLQVCQQLKMMRQWRLVPIIMLTSLSGEKTIENCLQAGADDFIHKPVRGMELRARVKSMLRIKKQFDRIESFTRLQHNKITLLEKDLVELGADLAVGFANELYSPLCNVIERFDELHQQVQGSASSAWLDIIKSGQRSATDLERLTNKFWIYMELALERRQFDAGETCMAKSITEQIVVARFSEWARESDVSLTIEPAELAMTAQHYEWAVKELLDDALQYSEPGTPVKINGWIDHQKFHLRVSNSLSLEPSVSMPQTPDLVLSLKTVKRIVDIYDGTFSFYHVDPERQVYITLPQA
jgi:two-component system, sensor histidine kinase and response regulator